MRPGLLFFVDINTEANAGVKKIASSMEMRMAKVSVVARARKKIPGTPVRNTRGMKTTKVVSVAPRSGK